MGLSRLSPRGAGGHAVDAGRNRRRVQERAQRSERFVAGTATGAVAFGPRFERFETGTVVVFPGDCRPGLRFEPIRRLLQRE